MELVAPLGEILRLNDGHKKALSKLGLETIWDLLFYFPSRHNTINNFKKVSDLILGENTTVCGKITNLKTRKAWKTKIPIGEAYLEDLSGKVKIIWFNQAYMAKIIKSGEIVKLTGRVTSGKNGIYLANPELETEIEMDFGQEGNSTKSICCPIYSEKKGITSKWIYHSIQKIFKNGIINQIEDYLPKKILEKYNLPSLKTALIWIHSPKKEADAISARKRFAFEEVLFIQLKRQHDRQEYKKNKSFPIKLNKGKINDFISRFSFELTKAQQKTINQIGKDISKKHPMSRLLEGDVGSGKTAVAATIAYATIQNRPPSTNTQGKQKKQDFGNLQIAYMAPTEVLANQLFESFIQYFKYLNINIGLITSSGCKKFPSKINPNRWTNISRSQLLKWVENGEIPILIGTHSLIQKTVKFKNLALVIIDEQHRFGTNQRSKLVKKNGFAPHFLSMTATPIPRTLALTIFGDLDLSLLDEMPFGRKQVITEIVTPAKRDIAYSEIKKEIKKGRQAYVICPRIFEADPTKELALNVKSVQAEAERLKKEIFQKENIEILHSKMTTIKKEKVMEDFNAGKIDILVSTSVIEVGVNVPNATVIIIEGAERFGLAQLHQLRGRVLRSEHQAYCYIFSDTKTKKGLGRLKAIKTAKNGFELSEMDLELRGSGELTGIKQWGISDIGMEAIKNIKMVEAARNEAQEIIAEDLELKNYPKLKEILEQRHLDLHFE